MGAVLGPHCIIGTGCTVGAQSRLVARVTLVTRVTLGKRVLVHPGAVIGSDGFGLAFDRDAYDHGGWIKLPQLGGVRIGDDCEIGANTTIDRGALEDTVLEEDVRLDNQIQNAHNVYIGRTHRPWPAAQRWRAAPKSARYCQIGGNAGVLGHLETRRPRYHYGEESGHQLDPRAGRILVGRTAAGKSGVAQECGSLQTS